MQPPPQLTRLHDQRPRVRISATGRPRERFADGNARKASTAVAVEVGVDRSVDTGSGYMLRSRPAAFCDETNEPHARVVYTLTPLPPPLLGSTATGGDGLGSSAAPPPRHLTAPPSPGPSATSGGGWGIL